MLSGLNTVAERVLHRIGPALHATASTLRRRRQGLAAPTRRPAFLAALKGRDALEIGPFNNPMLSGDGVAYFDVLDSAALGARAVALGLDPANVPDVEFVSPMGDLGTVDRRFSAVLTCHSIEHQPDLIEHLQQVERVLRPGGRYYAIIPDKRYCFDHFMPLSTIDDVHAAHRDGRPGHTPDAVRAHFLSVTHNFPMRHWTGRHGRPAATAADRQQAEQEAARAERGEYVDVHAWFFAPAQFRALIDRLYAQGEIGLRPVTVNATRFGELEFFAVLERAG